MAILSVSPGPMCDNSMNMVKGKVLTSQLIAAIYVFLSCKCREIADITSISDIEFFLRWDEWSFALKDNNKVTYSIPKCSQDSQKAG